MFSKYFSAQQPVGEIPESKRVLDIFVHGLESTLPAGLGTKMNATEASKHLAKCLFSYAALLARRLVFQLVTLEARVLKISGTGSENFDDEGRRLGEKVFASLNYLQMTAVNARSNYLDFVRHHGLEEPSEYLEILEEVHSKTTQLKSVLDGCLQRQVSILNLEESRKSIRLADNVNVVTQLAFVFLPLTFSSSLFGMNITELGSGTSHV
jgi:Mg2+ and Co2+ transporter CorA